MKARGKKRTKGVRKMTMSKKTKKKKRTTSLLPQKEPLTQAKAKRRTRKAMRSKTKTKIKTKINSSNNSSSSSSSNIIQLRIQTSSSLKVKFHRTMKKHKQTTNIISKNCKTKGILLSQEPISSIRVPTRLGIDIHPLGALRGSSEEGSSSFPLTR
jgi:hypothetical protein